MAVYRVINSDGKYKDDYAVHDVLHYVVSKAAPDSVVGGAVLPGIAEISMKGVAKAYGKDKGTRLRHSVLSFDPNDCITPRQAKDIAQQALDYYQDDYQILAAVHEDKDHLHIHFAMNSVNYRNGSKYRGKKDDYYRFIGHMNKALQSYGIRVHPAKK